MLPSWACQYQKAFMRNRPPSYDRSKGENCKFWQTYSVGDKWNALTTAMAECALLSDVYTRNYLAKYSDKSYIHSISSSSCFSTGKTNSKFFWLQSVHVKLLRSSLWNDESARIRNSYVLFVPFLSIVLRWIKIYIYINHLGPIVLLARKLQE